MLVVLEGIDGTGKSTLAHHIVQTTGGGKGRVLHYSAPKKHPLREYCNPVVENHRPAKDLVVLDRYHWGEAVWPRLFGRNSEFNKPMWLYVEMLLQSRNVVTILCDDTPHNAYARSDKAVPPAILATAQVGFRNLKLESLDNVLTYHVQRSGAQELRQILKAITGRGRGPNDILDVTHDYVGSPYPEVLLVGERISKVGTGHVIPFVPYRGTSGYYLMTALTMTGELPGIVGITNSFSPRGRPRNLERVYEALGEPPKVVALGRAATTRLRYYGIPSHEVPHPQYWRRFKNKDLPGYATRLMEAVK